MAKAKPKLHPDYETLMTFDEVDAELWVHKDTISKKVRTLLSIKQNKKDMVGGFNSELKELEEELEHEAGVLDALEDRRKVLAAAPSLAAVK